MTTNTAMNLEFFTRREYDTLQTGTGNTDYINNIKVRISKRCKNVEEWSYRYVVAESILKSLEVIGTANTSDGEWNWHVPRSPTNLYKVDEGKKYSVKIVYVAEPARVVDALPAIFNRPRAEMMEALCALGAGTDELEGNLSFLKFDVGLDLNGHYIRVRWATKLMPRAFNNIYMHRGKPLRAM